MICSLSYNFTFSVLSVVAIDIIENFSITFSRTFPGVTCFAVLRQISVRIRPLLDRKYCLRTIRPLISGNLSGLSWNHPGRSGTKTENSSERSVGPPWKIFSAVKESLSGTGAIRSPKYRSTPSLPSGASKHTILCKSNTTCCVFRSRKTVTF